MSTTLYTPKRFFFNFCFGKKLKQKQIGFDAILFPCLARVAMFQGLQLLFDEN